jgi:hypothetical protein
MAEIKNTPDPVVPPRQRAGETLLKAACLESEAASDYCPSQAYLQEMAQGLTEQVRNKREVRRELTEMGAGGELLPCEGRLAVQIEAKALPADALRNTVANPDYVAIDANRHRLELASRTGTLEMGTDLADTVEAGNSLEKMLAHQMAATHRAGMQFMVRLNRNLEILECLGIGESTVGFFQVVNTETCRLVGAVARLQKTFQDAAMTLQRLRTGGKQTVVVQHVNVRQGGQAVVAGQVGGGRGPSKPTGINGK